MSDRGVPLDESALILRLRDADAGDAGIALRALAVAYYDALIDFAASYVRSLDAAEDVVQDVFVRLWAQRERVDPARSLRPRLFLATRNAALDQRRRGAAAAKYASLAADVNAGVPAALAAPDDVLERSELAAAVASAIEALPPRCREIYLLNRRAGLSYPEIAQALGVSLSTVKTQMGRAVQTLSVKLAPFLTLLVAVGR
jgi:RNA polymerase sigma-70 factor (ECF subfamily)